MREAIALLHKHSVSQLPVVGGDEVVGLVGERGLLRRAIDVPTIMDTVIAEVMEEPFPSVATPTRPRGGRAARRRAPGADRHRGRQADGILTRADLLESLVT